MTSPKDVTVPSPPITLPSDALVAKNYAIFLRFRQPIHSFCKTANSHDRVTILIAACIDAGINTGSRIIGVAVRLGFNSQHAGIILSAGVGLNWNRDEDGHYSNLI